MRVDLNCDMGESFGRWELGADAGVMPHITSANIACGGHAGDPATMRRTLRLAREHGVAAGAHPGFDDLAGFGRREIPMPPDGVADLVIVQLGALQAMARAEGMQLAHVKPHGALYNMAARTPALADAIARAVALVDPSLVLFGLAGSPMLAAAERCGLAAAAEGFADRSYEPDGSLTPRSLPGAVIDDVETVVSRAIRMVREARVTARDGTDIHLRIDTICVHGDTPGAAVLAGALSAGLRGARIRLVAPGRAA